uniref:Uncharacterized protein n=1 Tax=Magallana gigas TaxID=29159 RepID=K1RPJ9_MAGGI
MDYLKCLPVLLSCAIASLSETVPLPSFQKLLHHYPGYKHFGGRFSHHRIVDIIAFGPYMADKFGYPSISVLHDKDPIATKRKFWGKQGIMEIITYTKFGNKPKGHIALWNCDRLYQTKDWISKHSLLTIQFWESPDSKCDTVFQKDNSPSQVTGTWGGRKYDTLRLKAARKLVRFNQIYRKMPHRLIKFQY